MSTRSPEIGPGEVVAGKYRVVRELGRGGMGLVLAADHLQLGQPVALKVMLRSGDARALERFQREARIVARLQSQHACKIFDVGALPDGTPFMVMELLHGETLRDLSRRRGWLGIEQAVDALLQASEAIAEAHVMGVVHRDLKPENLFVTRGLDGQPCIKVLDFGISKVFSSDGQNLTESGEILGSPRFMAPEQLQRHRGIDMRTDVWALGVVLYELLTGKAAFRADTMAELLVFILQDDPDPIGGIRPDVPKELVQAVARCLEKDAERRFANVAELAVALGPFASARGRPYVDRICHIASEAGWSPVSSAAPPTVVDRRPPSTTAVSEPLPPTAPTARAFPTLVHSGGLTSRPQTSLASVDGQATMHSHGHALASRRGGRWLAVVAVIVAVVGVAAYAQREEAASTPRQEAEKNLKAEEDVTPPSPPPRAPEPQRHDLEPSVVTATYDWAPRLLKDAISRNAGHAAIYQINLVHDGFAQFEMQHPKISDRVQRHTYRGLEFEATTVVRLSDGDRAELLPRLFPAADLRIERLPEVVADALRRIGDPEALVENMVIRRITDRTLDPTLGTFVNRHGAAFVQLGIALPDRDELAHYWADGSFRCESIGYKEFPSRCPGTP